MSSLTAKPAPPDQTERQRALDPASSILVQAPAGSGKTDLLTRRFLRLLAEVEEPGQIVAITFTNAAAAEMRHRILGELEKAASDAPQSEADEFSMESLASRALERSRLLGWKLLDLPAQLRIMTIDSFCRELALQQPLLSGLGSGLGIFEHPAELYRRAARQTLEQIGKPDDPLLSQAIEDLLLWRDNNWQEMEDLLVEMLSKRDRWMHDFVLSRQPDWEALRERLERPFSNAVHEALSGASQLLDQAPGAREEALDLARFACELSVNALHRELAELAEFPSAPFTGSGALEGARQAHINLAALLLTGDGTLRKQVDKRLGFPADRKPEKGRLLELLASLRSVPGLESALASVRNLPPARYTEEDWQIVRACFTLLRHAAGQLQVVFAEAGAVDFIEVAQIAQRVLQDEDGFPTDAAMAVSDGIRHLLVDEFQDTSRRQHQLLAGLIAAWPERTGRTCFAVGDPMQSIYFFRDADAELFPRVREFGLEIPSLDPAEAEPLHFDPIALTANFRTAPPLVEQLNEHFARIFTAGDGSGITFSPAQPCREGETGPGPSFKLHLSFVPQTTTNKHIDGDESDEKETARDGQTGEIVALIRSHLEPMRQARERAGEKEKYRIAVLGRTRAVLAPVAQALREAAIPFRAIDLEKLKDRPEVLDALALAHALLNPVDRVAWLGVLRAPWCGLSLDDLHRLSSADEPELLARPVPELLAERLPLLSQEGRSSAGRVLEVWNWVPALRAAHPAAAAGTWLEQVWLRLGGASCVDAAARANLDLLWRSLDHLPEGEQDLLGPGLDAALDKLTALPDPEASSDYGVQLMTIHKSKGLEFEVVIVPELQAASGGRNGRKMLSWLERGLTIPGDTGEVTEFLIAPLQSKGADRGTAKSWVDRVYHEREAQEDRRILYVVATRAREELHLFARPACKLETDGTYSLPNPAASLLATAWPALEDEVRAQFEAWKAAGESEVETMAASAESNLLVMPTRSKLLRRLPPDFCLAQEEDFESADSSVLGMSRLYSRHEGGLLSRALGSAVHALLEELAKLRITEEWEPARAALQRIEGRIAAQIRAAGVEPSKAAGIAAEALHHALDASKDPLGQWILSPHAGAASEVRWAGVVAGSLRTVRVDRVFQAGPAPASEGEDCWWIVDYKTAHADTPSPEAALPGLRRLFAPQVEAYAQVLRNLHGKNTPIRAGLYYPRMLLLDWWEM